MLLTSCAATGRSDQFVLDLRDGQDKSNFRGTPIRNRGFIFETSHLEVKVVFNDEEIVMTGSNKGADFTGEQFGSIYARQTGFDSTDVVDTTIERANTAGIEVDRAEIQAWVNEMEAIGEGTTQFPRKKFFGTRYLPEPDWHAFVGLLVQSPNDYTIIFSMQEEPPLQ